MTSVAHQLRSLFERNDPRARCRLNGSGDSFTAARDFRPKVGIGCRYIQIRSSMRWWFTVLVVGRRVVILSVRLDNGHPVQERCWPAEAISGLGAACARIDLVRVSRWSGGGIGWIWKGRWIGVAYCKAKGDGICDHWSGGLQFDGGILHVLVGARKYFLGRGLNHIGI